MNSILRFRCYQNYIDRRYLLMLQREFNIERYLIRTYCSKKDIIDKLDNLDQKIETIVRKKTVACLETKCKQEDGTLPDCKKSTVVATLGRKEPVEPIPTTCTPRVTDICIRPYFDPCPQYPVKPCTPHFRPVHPCRDPCIRPRPPIEDDGKIMELSIRVKKILLALTTLLALFMIYKVFFVQDQCESGKCKKKRFVKPKESPKLPSFSPEIPNRVPYLIVGGGPAAYSAMKTLMSLDSDAKILLINQEPYYPYNRTTLNTELLTGDPNNSRELLYVPRTGGKKKSIYLERNEFYTPCHEMNLDQPGKKVSVACGWSVVKLDHDKKYVLLEDGKKISYGKCILATGTSPKTLGVFTENSDDVRKRVITYNSLYDYLYVEELLTAYKNNLTIAIIGSGLVATELACSLRMRGAKIVQVYKESSNLTQLLPQYLSEWLTKKMTQMGITTIGNGEVLDALIWKGGENDGNLALIVGSSQSTKNYLVFVDRVIVAVGNRPNTDLAKESNIEVDKKRGGFLVNQELMIRKDLYAAGDCISYYDGKYGRRHIEHYEHAIESGKVAAQNMFNKGNTFDIQTMLWSDVMPSLSYEAVGVIDPSLPTVGIYVKEENGETEMISDNAGNKDEGQKTLEDFYKGVVFYLKNETVVGVLTWNVLNRTPLIRNILQKNMTYDDLDKLAKLMHIHV